ncbi:hypothetical protein [Streptomyces sp. MP131-18]|uniref:hypothetical protein n=1 Tax=Streptomyces sp. MP131-18 TaxID=1857892 RepID=UPI00097C5453|nr:hypothetical protein [Streptomyces sp. MP131-18]ONK10257.1 hypothetical protein STBA_09790 [Streptomyces sp. MP131-18]
MDRPLPRPGGTRAPKAVDAFAAAYVRMYWTFAFRRPEERWLKAMAEAAESWANHRGLVVV